MCIVMQALKSAHARNLETKSIIKVLSRWLEGGCWRDTKSSLDVESIHQSTRTAVHEFSACCGCNNKPPSHHWEHRQVFPPPTQQERVSGNRRNKANCVNFWCVFAFSDSTTRDLVTTESIAQEIVVLQDSTRSLLQAARTISRTPRVCVILSLFWGSFADFYKIIFLRQKCACTILQETLERYAEITLEAKQQMAIAKDPYGVHVLKDERQ